MTSVGVMIKVSENLKARKIVPASIMSPTTHYASPRASLAQALQDVEDDWCEVKKEGRQAVFSIPGSDFHTPVRAINAS
jgi:hypothetical protein